MSTAARVFLLRMFAAKNSTNWQAGLSAARAIKAGREPNPARVRLLLGIRTTERAKLARVNDGKRLRGVGPNAGSYVLYATASITANRRDVKTLFHRYV